MFVPYHCIWSPFSFDLAFVSDFASFAASEAHEFTDQAPKGKAMARVTPATAFGHPLGPQQRLTSALAPYQYVAPPIFFDLALVSDFALC